MQVQIFTLPLMPDAAQTEEMNHFLRSHKVIDVRKASPMHACRMASPMLAIRCGNAMVKSGKVIESTQHSKRVSSTLQMSRLNTLFESAQCPS